jgi:hypothetical protein
MLSEQEIFDRVAAHLLTQGVQAKNSQEDYLYRTNDGLKCAVGCLIDDDAYDPALEGLGVTSDSDALDHALRESNIDTDNPRVCHLLTDLQRLHDNHPSEPDDPLPEWRAGLTTVASDNGLSTAVLDAFPAGD